MDSSRNTTSRRPTLPPLRTLNLPTPAVTIGRAEAITLPNTTTFNDSYEHISIADNYPHLPKTRHASNSSISSSSSMTTSSSRTPSPPLSDSSPSTRSKGGVRLVPCPMEIADAVILVTEPTPGSSRGKALLLVGPAAQPYRQPGAKIAKGARVHPYKITPSQMTSRRSSTTYMKPQIN